MKWDDVIDKSEKEVANTTLSFWMERVKSTIKAHPLGCDLRVPECVIPLLEEELDRQNIPVYHLDINYISVAVSYTQLVEHEKYR